MGRGEWREEVGGRGGEGSGGGAEGVGGEMDGEMPELGGEGGIGRGEGLERERRKEGCYQSINQSKRKTSNANGQTNLGHKHKAPDHNHEATQPMVDLPHTS